QCGRNVVFRPRQEIGARRSAAKKSLGAHAMTLPSDKIIAAFAKQEVTKSCGEIFFIDTVHLVNAPAREFNRPPHPEIVFQNPAKFGTLERRNLAAPTQFGDYRQNHDAGGHLALHGASYTQ